jgi:hypothetical protein
MQSNTRHLPVLALLDLPVEAQQLLARNSDVDARRALASSPHADPTVLDRLAADSDRITHHTALRRISDAGVLHERLRRSSTCCRINVLRNPAVAPEILDEALVAPDKRERLAAYVNPSTPVQSRALLTPGKVHALVYVGEPIGETVVRSHEALLANRALLGRMTEFSPALRRAAFALADLSADEHGALRRLGRAGRYGGRHPVTRDRQGAIALSADELLDLRSPAADLWLATSSGTDVGLARRIMTRKGHHVEPHIIARLIRRFGAGFIPAEAAWRISVTRLDSTAWADPAGWFFNHLVTAKADGSYQELIDSLAVLGDDRQSWESYITLLPDWNGNLIDLASSARSL